VLPAGVGQLQNRGTKKNQAVARQRNRHRGLQALASTATGKKGKEKKRLQKACSRNERKRRRYEEKRDPIDTKEAPMAMVVEGQVRERKTPAKQYLLLLTSRDKKKA